MIDPKLSAEQEDIFNALIREKIPSKLCHIAGYVQNDFQRMHEDGMITKEMLQDNLTELKEAYDDLFATLNQIKEREVTLIEKVISQRKLK